MNPEPTTSLPVVDDVQIGEVIVICCRFETAKSNWDEAKKAAAQVGGKLDTSAPRKVLTTGTIPIAGGGSFELDGSGMKAVVYQMRGTPSKATS